MNARRSRPADDRWKLAVGATLQLPTVLRLSHSAPLLEEKRDGRAAALISQGKDPFPFHGPRSCTALTANDDPVNSGQVDCAEILEERLDREKSNRCFG